MKAKVEDRNADKVKNDIMKLLEIIVTNNNFEIVKQMKKIVPEFKSQNFIYEELDIEIEEIK